KTRKAIWTWGWVISSAEFAQRSTYARRDWRPFQLLSASTVLQQPAAQRVGQRLGDQHIDKLVEQRLRPVKVHPPHVLGAARQLARILLRRTFNQHTLYRAHHPFADGHRLLIDACLQEREPPLLLFVRDIVRQRCSRGSRTTAIDEAEGLIETDFSDQVHRL